MPSVRAAEVVLSDRIFAVLTRISRTRTASAVLVERATLLLLAAEGGTNAGIGRALGVDRQRVRRWRTRWSKEIGSALAAVEEVADDRVLRVAVEEALSDRPRSGTPPKFTEDQIERVRAVACRSPSEFDLPHSQWSHALLARIAAEQGIVESVSVAEVGRWLKKGGFNRTGSATG